jgi:hypothetical protein
VALPAALYLLLGGWHNRRYLFVSMDESLVAL